MTDAVDRILEAALRCFTEHGVEATSIVQIRAAAGVSTGSLYHHFPSKEVLAATLYARGVERFQSMATAALRSAGTAEAGVRGIAKAHLDWVAANPDWARYLLTQPRPRPHPDDAGRQALTEVATALKRQNQAFFREVVAWCEARIAAGELRPLPVDLFLPIVLGPGQEYARNHLAGRLRSTPSDAVSPLCDAAWRAVRPEERP